MEHLIKLYSHFLGETLHLERIFPNSLYSFHQLYHLIQLSPEFPAFTKTNRTKISVGFFLRSNQLINNT